MNEPSAPIYVRDLQGRPAFSQLLADYAKPVFLVALLLSTWLPMAFFLLSSRMESSVYGFAGIKTLLLFVGTAHVPATIYFYLDKDFSGIIKHHNARYVYFPIFLTIVTGFLFAFANTTVQAYILLTFWAWQAFHYGRQNVGIFSFISIATRGTPPDKFERIVIDLGTYCGVVGTFQILGIAVAPNYLHPFLHSLYRFGGMVFVVVLFVGILVYLKNWKRTNLLLTIFYFTLVCFFLPVFLSTDMNVAFYSYAIAHGAQYMVFMTVVSLHSDPPGSRSSQIRNLAKLLLVIGVVGFLFYRAIDLKTIEFFVVHVSLMRIVDFIVGAILGATMAHFVIDAGAWRLSKPLQRMYIGKRFAFVFDRPAKDPLLDQ